jgi:RNA polymerase sigma-70 factor, ECF subfamily
VFAAGTGGPSRSSPPEPATPAFEQVYRAHAAAVYRFCLSQVRNPADAEDVAAEVFVSALGAYTRAAPAAQDVLAWLLRIARNEIIDRARRHRRRSLLLARFFGGASEEDPRADVESAAVVGDELRRVLQVIKRLSPRDQTLVGLRLASELSYAEIGAVLGLSEHAATVATRRALQRLRDRLGGRQ